MSDKTGSIPVGTRIAAWLCSAVIGVAAYAIFWKVSVLFQPSAALLSKLEFWAMVIGVVAGTGSFALFFVNWLTLSKQSKSAPPPAETKASQ